jgi:predicted SnoaL-like aldol condensation-catalyzing enzyme
MAGKEENRAVVRRFIDEVIVGGQLDVIAELCDPEIVNHAAAPSRQHGLDGVSQVVRGSLMAMPEQRWRDVTMVAGGNHVVVHGIREGGWVAPEFRGIAIPQEGPVAVEVVHIFRLRDGLIVEHWAVGDDLGMLKQLGALP